MLRFSLPLFCWILLHCVTSYGQKNTTLTAGVIRRLDSISLQDVPPRAPGIATAIIQKGKLVYQNTAGFANLEDSTKITPLTRFNIASNGKQFTALAILLLVDAKKISLSDDIRKYLPGIFPNLKQRISIENLLNHTSGIRDVYDLWSLEGLTWWEHTFDNGDVLALIAKQKDLNAAPGSTYQYSNTNYMLLACIIERVTGKSFVSFTNEMFSKLNMKHTSFEDDYKAIRGPIAKAYFNFGTWTTYNWIWNAYGDGNIFSTLSDQIQWEKLLQGDKNTTISKKLLLKSQQLTDNTTIRNYGYGLEFGSYKGLPYKFHEGATGAWKATVVRFIGRDVSMITLTNSGKATPDRQTRQMADVYFNLPDDSKYFLTKPAKPGDEVKDEDIIGIYQTAGNFTFQFEKRDNAIYLKRVGRNDVLLEREASNIFHQAYDPDFKQEFTRNAKGQMQVTAYYTSHAPYTLTKLDSDWTGFNAKTLNGSYSNDETNVMVTIAIAADKTYDVKIGNQDSTKGILVSPVKMLLDNYVLQFDKPGTGGSGFLLSGNRIANVSFRRIDK